MTDERQTINAAKRRGGKVGANAIVLDTLGDPGMGTRVAAEMFGLPAERKGRMVAFRCPDVQDGDAITGAGGMKVRKLTMNGARQSEKAPQRLSVAGPSC